ncbi:hypothetical protein EVAR_22812_1 [Eumeta japonica]|uniref:Uncharacterized protein n=1 Tax=Eumeta variegata TaxID=151549 RepID=A0A4C1VG96_EUMVA|nr:hypothetical protein EVAR_22812_1 [Eumeta japonica]
MIRCLRIFLQSSSITSGKQMFVYQSLLKVRQCSKAINIFSFIKTRSDHSIKGTSLAHHFGCFRLISIEPYGRLLLCFEVLTINPRFVTCYYVSHQISRLFLKSAKLVQFITVQSYGIITVIDRSYRRSPPLARAVGAAPRGGADTPPAQVHTPNKSSSPVPRSAAKNHPFA